MMIVVILTMMVVMVTMMVLMVVVTNLAVTRLNTTSDTHSCEDRRPVMEFQRPSIHVPEGPL